MMDMDRFLKKPVLFLVINPTKPDKCNINPAHMGFIVRSGAGDY